MGVTMGNPIIISGPYSGFILTDVAAISGQVAFKSIKVEHAEMYAWCEGAQATIGKRYGSGAHVYAQVQPMTSGSTATRYYDNMWFREPYIRDLTSGNIYIYIR